MAFFRTKITLYAFLALAMMITGSSGQPLTHITVYMHDIVSGTSNQSATSVRVAQAATSNQSATSFGVVHVIDDLLTAGPNSSTEAVGRAQGMYYFSSLSEFSLSISLNFVFTSGGYNGSTIAIQGKNAFFNAVRELAIVGGTGALRFASGYAEVRTVVLDSSTFNAILQYDLYFRNRI